MTQAPAPLEDVCEVAVERLAPVATDTYVLVTERPSVDYQAGQYARLWGPGGEHRAFSIASAPADQARLEFFISHSTPGSFTAGLLRQLSASGRVTMSLPHGTAGRTIVDDAPTLLVAGGAGYAYVRSLLFNELHSPRRAPVSLLWGVRSPDRLFDLETLDALCGCHPRFDWQAWVERPDGRDERRVGDVIDAISSLPWSPEAFEAGHAFIGGRREMVTAVRAALVCRGFPSRHIVSD